MKKISNLFERVPFFFFLLPAFLFLHIENEYRHLINYHFVYFQMVQLVIAALLIFFASLLFFRQLRKGSLFAFAFLLVYYYFCDLKDFLHFKYPGFFSSYTLLLPLLFILLIGLFVILRKSRSTFRDMFLYLNTLLVAVVLWEGISLLFSFDEKKTDLGDARKSFTNEYQPCDSCKKPDIYYFLFDGYTSSEVLKSKFAYNNPIDNYLSGKGFYVVPFSRSNYNLTPFSIGSEFNLNYLPGLKSDQEFFIKDYLPGVATVYHSELIPILQKEGYKIYNHSIFNFEHFPAAAKPFDLWEINQIYARHNIFWKADSDIGWLIRQKLRIHGKPASLQAYVDAKDKHLQLTIDTTLAVIHAKLDQPKFVYSHFVMPHGPYSFDSAGVRFPPKPFPLSWDDYRNGYLGELKYANFVIKGLVDAIFQNAKRPAIIIIQGDHGFRFNEPETRHLQFANFNAMYFPKEKYQQLGDSITNVNTFRFVLNAFFDKKLPILKDTSIFLHY